MDMMLLLRPWPVSRFMLSDDEFSNRFSISKWIHVNGGDDGLRSFFQRIFSVLKPDGIFILEAQEWETYKKVKRLNEVSSRSFSDSSWGGTDVITVVESRH